MLFNSQEFLLVFLPLTLMGYYTFASSEDRRIWFLIVASIVFYAYWDLRVAPLLIGSVVVNWIIANLYVTHRKKALLLVGVTFNLLGIGFFKYTNFLVGNVAAVMGRAFTPWDIVLPLGISFFTFQQISYLVDLRRESAPLYPFGKYALYVTFFPQLISGPIVRHNEIIGQYALDPFREGLHERLSRGFGLFLIGLFKKVILADNMAQVATTLFDQAAAGKVLSLGEGWTATGAYTLQLYFDFSGYSDMAIGLGLMFGLSLPLNFNAPYVALSFQDIWRRWHMTLSRFFRDYVYFPLGGSLFGPRRQVLAIALTMVLCGLWHGASWPTTLWGVMQGIVLIVNVLWRKTGIRLPKALAWSLTMLFWIFSLAVFRSATVAVGGRMLLSLVGMNGTSLSVADYPRPWLVLLYAIPAVLGPTSQKVALEWLRARPVYAVAIAVSLLVLVLKIGDAGYSEFIYFQF